MTRAQWETMKPSVRPGVLEKLAAAAPSDGSHVRRVLLCFLSDPYQPLAAETGATREALSILAANQIPFQVLTKGGTLACSDFDLYTPRDALAVTLTSVDSSWSVLEPGAAPNSDRIEALFEAKRRGIETWVSLEPVVDPAASLEVIRATREVVDLYKIGKINHDPETAARIDWFRFAFEAVNLCEKYSVSYYIKKDLAAYCDFAFRNTDNRRAGWRENRP
jgi:DNA repair photolyase